VLRFEEACARLASEIESKKNTFRRGLSELRQPIEDLLLGRYVYVRSTLIDNYYAARGTSAVQRSLHGGVLRSMNAQSAAMKSLKFDAESVVTRTITRRRRVERAERERTERERLRKVKEDAQQLRRNALADKVIESIIPLFPDLSLDQGITAMEQNRENIEATIDFLLPLSEAERQSRLGGGDRNNASTAERKGGLSDLMSSNVALQVDSGRSQAESHSDGFRLAMVVMKVTETHLVLRNVLDRNRMACDPESPTVHTIPLSSLIDDPDFRIASGDEIQHIDRALQYRVPVITYQVLDDDAFCPVDISPALQLKEYKMEWDPAIKQIVKVKHRKDGAILFQAIHDQGDGMSFITANTPIELFTQSIDEHTHNIAHLHLDDTRDEVAIDTVNLTGTDKQVDDYKDFSKDASGRALTYRVCVRDQAVVAVLHTLGNTVKRAHFHERRLPRVGDLVRVLYTKPTESSDVELPAMVARLVRVPIGLVVTNVQDDDSKVDVKSNNPQFDKETRACQHKHPTELHGFVDLEVLMEAGELRNEPRHCSVPVCYVYDATGFDHEYLTEQQDSILNAKRATLLGKVERLERALDGSDPTESMTLAEMSEMRQSIDSLRAQPDLQACVDPQRIKRIEANIRMAALQKRMGRS
jgi:hypothetical protein